MSALELDAIRTVLAADAGGKGKEAFAVYQRGCLRVRPILVRQYTTLRAVESARRAEECTDELLSAADSTAQ